MAQDDRLTGTHLQMGVPLWHVDCPEVMMMRIIGDSESRHGSSPYHFEGRKPRKSNKRQKGTADCVTAVRVTLSPQSVKNSTVERQEFVAPTYGEVEPYTAMGLEDLDRASLAGLDTRQLG